MYVYISFFYKNSIERRLEYTPSWYQSYGNLCFKERQLKINVMSEVLLFMSTRKCSVLLFLQIKIFYVCTYIICSHCSILDKRKVSLIPPFKENHTNLNMWIAHNQVLCGLCVHMHCSGPMSFQIFLKVSGNFTEKILGLFSICQSIGFIFFFLRLHFHILLLEVQCLIFFLSCLPYFFWFWLSSFLPFFHLPACLSLR